MPKPADRKQAAGSVVEARRGDERASTFLPDYSAAIVETVREPLVLLDAGLRVLVANAAFYRAFGGSPDLIRRRSIFDLAEGRWDAPELHTVLLALRDQGLAFEDHEVRVTIDGKPRIYRLNARTLTTGDADQSTLLLAFEDVTELLRVEERLRDLARMEAIGQLAGGVAHEINNHMTVLTGYLAYVTRDMPPDHPKRQDLHQAEHAAEHVVYITRQLLNFSRKQMIKPEIIDPWAVVTGLHRLLGRLLGSGIQFNVLREGETGRVKVDPEQLSEVFVNLALNSRYAMGRSGRFEIALAAVEVDEGSASRFPDQAPGRYIRFEVRDTGMGMDEQTRKRVFEPFFTTKPAGEGTGLGLASVYGSVAQNGGFIRVESAVGAGTTFIIELPEVAGSLGAGADSIPAEMLPRGTETIIVADDEDGVRTWIARVLRDCGYTVLEARHGAEALRLYAENAATVRLVLTDLVMPGRDGRELGERLAAAAPHVPVLYMSAYSEDDVRRRQLLGPADTLLQKPFSASQLAQCIRAALDSGVGANEDR
jgi:two-component system, cell cycle sensor histidine kinase and response regulator CckA